MDSADLSAVAQGIDPGRSPRASFDLVAVIAALPTATALFAADGPRFPLVAASDTLLAIGTRPCLNPDCRPGVRPTTSHLVSLDAALPLTCRRLRESHAR